jgi:fibro-slime domain-containing protein
MYRCSARVTGFHHRSCLGLLVFVGALGCGGSDSKESDAGDPGSGGGLSGDASLEAGADANCGNGELESAEVCDDGNTQGGDGCSADCSARDWGPGDCTQAGTCADLCGNGKFDPTETCDDGNTDDADGCGGDCKVEQGWGCARPNSACVRLPVCGNSVRERGEECDSGPISDPGCGDCKILTGFWCSTPGQACLEKRCGNGARTPEEACDDANTADGDGCSTSCVIESGWRCSSNGCRPICGDSLLHGSETCEDGNTVSGDGCSAGCRVEPGASCGTLGAACGAAACGNTKLEGGEGCDDGNLIGGDGCGPTCQLEPEVSVGPSPVVHTRCGDGVVTSGEACDDGNAANGDGCSSTCAIESGFTCEQTIVYPASVGMKVTYRDFKVQDVAGGHPHMRPAGPTPDGLDLGIAGAVCKTSNGDACGRVDSDGKPLLADGSQPTVSAAITQNDRDAYSLWYRDGNPSHVAGANGEIQIASNPTPVPAAGDFITLTRDPSVPSTNAYSFDSASFFPLNGRGFMTAPGNNFHFTTELRSFFQYKGGETLTFRGDDDVWVFINGRLAVDIGGIHNPEWGRVVLGDDGAGIDDSNCTVSGGSGAPIACAQSAAELGDDTDTRFGLTKGNVYEIVLFNAERHPGGSNFHLTLSGFLAPRSYCIPTCGDGIVAGWETCDSGSANANGVYGVCNTSCSAMEYCGDNIRQSAHEACDNGFNQDLLYTSGDTQACAPGCVLPPACGDGVVQAPYELCDNGASNDDSAYDGCNRHCDWGPYCGDGKVDPSEVCDEGAGNVAGDQAGQCGYDCQPAFILL